MKTVSFRCSSCGTKQVIPARLAEITTNVDGGLFRARCPGCSEAYWLAVDVPAAVALVSCGVVDVNEERAQLERMTTAEIFRELNRSPGEARA